MTKRYTILQKKLQEVESQLKKVLLLPPETPYHEKYAEDIEQKLDFLKNLFSTERASSPQNSQHLQHIGKTLTVLESVFKEWNEFRTTPDRTLDTVSSCSCTESCLNDDDVVEGEDCVVEEKKKEEVKQDTKVCGGGTRVAMAFGMVVGLFIGLGLSVLSFVVVSLSHSSPSAMFLTPT